MLHELNSVDIHPFFRQGYGIPSGSRADLQNAGAWRSVAVDIGHGSAETLNCVARLRAAGVEAEADVYHTDYDAFDLLKPDFPLSREVIGKLSSLSMRLGRGSETAGPLRSQLVHKMDDAIVEACLGE